MKRFPLILSLIHLPFLIIVETSFSSEHVSSLDALPVAVYHPVYNFLERGENQGWLIFHGGSKPLTRGEILRCLKSIPSDQLTAGEKKQLARWRQEFDPDYLTNPFNPASNIFRARKNIWQNFPFYRDGYNLYNYQTESFYAAVNPILYWDFLTDSTGELITRRSNGLNFIAGFSDKLALSFDFRDNLETGRGPYNSDDRDKLYSDHAGYVTLNQGDVCYYDFTRAVLASDWGNLRLQFGRNDFAWGPARSGHLMMSNNPPPFDFLSLRYDKENIFRFTFITGKIYPYPEVPASEETTNAGLLRRIIANKFLSAHRLEIYPLKGIEIGLAESVIYGERSMEPAYLNPINLYYSAQHNLGDMDNVAWSGDIEVHPLPHLRLYGELFIDDMRTGKLGSDYIGNKFAYLAGAGISDPLNIPDIDLTIEYARLDPFVYTHIYQINTYKNWNSSLGYWLPPNSEALLIDLTWQPYYTFTAGLSAEIARHGENTDAVNAGGDIDTPPDYQQMTAPFLAGHRIYTNLYQFICRWEPLEDYSLTGRLKWRKFTEGEQLEWQFTFGVNVWQL